jgi:putative ABC transport system ATP-binding protein
VTGALGIGGKVLATVVEEDSTAQDEPLAALRHVTKEYTVGGTIRTAVDDVSLEVWPGRFLTVMGPSGSGKSTLLHMLGGLVTPTRGAVVVGGRDQAGMSDKERSEVRRYTVGFIFQAFNLVPVLTAAENVGLPARIAGDRDRGSPDNVERLLGLVGLEGRGGETPSNLSGGEQQRVAIARALVMEPRIVLADEPTGNLDSASAVQLMATLRRLQQVSGTAVVLVTHDARAGAFGDEVALLRDGRVADRLELDGWTTPEAEDLSLQRFGDERSDEILAWLQTDDQPRRRRTRRR